MAVSTKAKIGRWGCDCCTSRSPRQRRRLVRTLTKRDTRRMAAEGVSAYRCDR